jgi:hypothetical protein
MPPPPDDKVTGFVLGLLLDQEDGSDIFLRKLGLSPNYTALRTRYFGKCSEGSNPDTAISRNWGAFSQVIMTFGGFGVKG